MATTILNYTGDIFVVFATSTGKLILTKLDMDKKWLV